MTRSRPARAATALLLGGTGALVAPTLAARAWTASVIHPVNSPRLRPAAAALVLGARVWPDGRPSLFLRQRVEVAAALFARGLVTQVVLSGSGHNREGLDEVAAMERTAVAAGVPTEALLLDAFGVNTSASIANAAHRESVIVCSQEFHLPRAVALGRRAGLEVQGAYPPLLWRSHTAIGYAREAAATWKAVLTTSGTRD